MSGSDASADARYHHGNLRMALLERAGATIEAEGVENLSLRQLARDLGVSHGAPGRHFRDKQALLDTLARDGFVELNARLEAAARNTGAATAGAASAVPTAGSAEAMERPGVAPRVEPELAPQAQPQVEAAARNTGAATAGATSAAPTAGSAGAGERPGVAPQFTPQAEPEVEPVVAPRVEPEAAPQTASATPDTGIAGRLERMTRAYVAFALERRALLPVMFSTPRAPDALPRQELRNAGLATTTALIRDAQAAGEVGPGDVDRRALAVFAAMHGVAVLAAAQMLDDAHVEEAIQATLLLATRR